MAKKATLVDDVLARAVSSRHGFRPWFDRLPPEIQVELEAVRQSFDPNVHQKRSFARAVIEAARERGWETAGEQGVIKWLVARN